jgi:transcriptional regulator with XRE-family HTH domain
MEEQARSRVTREEWAKRVERWRDSGLSAAEFAAELGINARTLVYWKYILGKEARGERRVWPSRKARTLRAARKVFGKAPAPSVVAPGLVEVHAVSRDERFELELGAGRRLRVPRTFEAAELRRLLDVLEAR